MDDLAEKLNQIFNDPQAMQQVSALAGMLNASHQSSQEEQVSSSGNSTDLANSGNLGALASLLGGQQQSQPQNEMMQSILQIMPMLNRFQQEDEGTRLLQSLRPLLGPVRQKKLDEAAKMMKMFRILPLLKEKGIL